MKNKTSYHFNQSKIAFLFDVDNTLLDRDRFVADLRSYLEKQIGRVGSQCYWSIFDQLWSELGYADYLGALQRYCIENRQYPRLFSVACFLINYQFFNNLFPNALAVIERMKQLGAVVILSDGDAVFQPHKIRRSGLYDAVNGNVLIYVHKERELDDVMERFPADHYIMVDDKPSILNAIKQILGPRITTVLARQGCFALDPKAVAAYPAADLTIDRVGELLDIKPRRWAKFRLSQSKRTQ
jgi:FMN phosphatase YigB (HAD superfamily)